MIFRVGAERSRRRSVHKVHDCGENREGNNPENSAVKGIYGENSGRMRLKWASCRIVILPPFEQVERGKFLKQLQFNGIVMGYEIAFINTYFWIC
ncbi:MAG: hypothetical protein U1E78_13650 [Gammaproteobacteria bacterium]